MFKPSYTKQFKRDLKRVINSGKDKEKIKEIMTRLTNQEVLEKRYKDHKLVGQFKNRRECHIEPDWLLIYKIDGDEIIFERTGSHSELFD